MDRFNKNKVSIQFFTAAFWLMALLLITANFAIADSSNKQQSPTKANSVTVDNAQSTGNIQVVDKSDSILNKLISLFPQLERALVIATIINLVIIIFAILLYSAKRKMSRFSPAPLANIKQD